MGIFGKLETDLSELENEEKHEGYWDSMTDALLVLICGLLCKLENIDDIHDWATSVPTRKFLKDELGMKRIFSCAQFYNLIRLVDAEAFKKSLQIGWGMC